MKMKQVQHFFQHKPVSAMLRVFIITVIGLQGMLFVSCKHDDLSVALPNENIRPAGDFVKNNYELSLFYAALKKTGYAEQLNGTGPFTVLAPTNEAFNGMGIFNAADFDKLNPDTLKKLIGYHILPRLLRVSAIPSNGVDVRYATLEGSELYASLASTNPAGGAVGNVLYFSGANASRKDVTIANGTLHVLSKVMKPNFGKTVQRWLAEQKDYTVFVKGLKKFGLWDQLANPGNYTLFAPDNAALEKVGITSTSLDAMDKENYLGDRLFGVYVLYDRHFFISDLQIFSYINSNGYYNYQLKNDPVLVQLAVFPRSSAAALYYQLQIRAGGGIFDPVYKTVESDFYQKTDNLCSNGLVHYLVDGLITPEQALKK